jgi:hypothetical protein
MSSVFLCFCRVCLGFKCVNHNCSLTVTPHYLFFQLQLELRLREVAKLGFRRCFVPFIASTALNYPSRSASASGKMGAPPTSSPPLVVSGTAVPGSRFFASLPDSLSIVPCKTLAEVLAYLPGASSAAPNARGARRGSGGFVKPVSPSPSSAVSPSPASLLPPFDESEHEFVSESDSNATDDAGQSDSERKVL